MPAIALGLALIGLAVAWLRHVERYEEWTRSTLVRLRLRRSGEIARPRWARVAQVWGGAAFLGVFGVWLVVVGLIKTL